MLRPTDDAMEVRLSPWDEANPNEKVVSWTNRGWNFFVEHGFPDEARSFMDDYSSLMFLDFKNRAHFINSDIIKRRWKNIINSCGGLIENIDLMLSIKCEVQLDSQKLRKDREFIEQMRNDAIEMHSKNYPRANRDPIYDYAEKLNFCASECGLHLTRGGGWNGFIENVYRMHASPLFLYLTEIEKIEPAIAEDQTNLLKQLRSETILKRIESIRKA